MTEQVPSRRGAQGRGGGVELEVLRLQHRTSGDTRHGGPAEQRHHEDDLPDGVAGLEHLQHHDGAKQNRQRGQAAQHGIDPASEEAGHRTDQRAEQHHEQRGEHTDAQGSAGTVDHAGVHIAALQVEAEWMACG